MFFDNRICGSGLAAFATGKRRADYAGIGVSIHKVLIFERVRRDFYRAITYRRDICAEGVLIVLDVGWTACHSCDQAIKSTWRMPWRR